MIDLNLDDPAETIAALTRRIDDAGAPGRAGTDAGTDSGDAADGRSPAERLRAAARHAADTLPRLVRAIDARTGDGAARIETDPAALRALANLLDRMNRAETNPLLLELCDALLALGLRNPIVPASGAQALVDFAADDRAEGNARAGGPMAALAMLDQYVPREAPDCVHLSVAYGVRGRARKDLFVALRGDDPDAPAQDARLEAAAQEGRRAFAAYNRAYDIATRALARTPEDGRDWLWRWPGVNAVAMLRQLMDLGEAHLPPELGGNRGAQAWLEARADDLRARIAALPGARALEPWNHATLAELAVAATEDHAAAIDHLENYLKAFWAKERAAQGQPDATKILGAMRQFTEVVAPDAPELAPARNALRMIALDCGGRVLEFNDAVLKDLHDADDNARDVERRLLAAWQDGRGEDHREAAYGYASEEMHLADVFRAVGEATLSTAAIVRLSGATIGTGFVVAAGDLLQGDPELPDPQERLLLTCAHVCNWYETGRGLAAHGDKAQPPDRLRARFEQFAQQHGAPPTDFTLRPFRTGWAHPQARDWLDISVLRFAPEQKAEADRLPILPIAGRAPAVRRKAYVLGHPLGDAMKLGMGRNDVTSPVRAPHPDKRAYYFSATRQGHSGGPVLVETGRDDAPAMVFAVHAGAEPIWQANYGVLLVEAARALTANP